MGYALLLGSMSGIIAALLCYYISSIRLKPGREILVAIKREQFYVVYQPVVDTQTLRVTGLEVLLRWRHPTAGEIPPDAFIHYAEAQQLIVPLTQHLFKLVARDAPRCRRYCLSGQSLASISRLTTCTATALKRTSVSWRNPYRRIIFRSYWKLPNAICSINMKRLNYLSGCTALDSKSQLMILAPV